MKRLFCLFLLSCILVSFDKNAPKVLLFIKEGSPQLEYMLTNEVGKMVEIIKQSGFDVTIATISGEVLKAGSVTVKPDLKLSEVNIDEYAGLILPCMVLDLASSEMITLVKTAADKGKPIAAQAGSVGLLAKAGILSGKKYALNHDAGMDPDFANSIYCGTGVVQDGKIITSGVCPWIAKSTGYQDGTSKLTQTLVDVINGKTPSPTATSQKPETQVKKDTIKTALITAQSFFKEGKTEEASKIYTSLMESHPDNKEAVQGWIIANMKRTPTGEEEMIGQLEGLEKLYPKNTAILFFKAYVQGEYKHYDESLATTEKLITMQPDSALNWGFQGGLLASMNKYEEAVSSYTRAIQLDPKQAEYIYNRGCAYCLKGDKENALADLKRAILLSPQLKAWAPKDEDLKSLWDDEDFKKLTL
jgi:putative intracellular protease/amidase